MGRNDVVIWHSDGLEMVRVRVSSIIEPQGLGGIADTFTEQYFLKQTIESFCKKVYISYSNNLRK